MAVCLQDNRVSHNCQHIKMLPLSIKLCITLIGMEVDRLELTRKLKVWIFFLLFFYQRTEIFLKSKRNGSIQTLLIDEDIDFIWGKILGQNIYSLSGSESYVNETRRLSSVKSSVQCQVCLSYRPLADNPFTQQTCSRRV